MERYRWDAIISIVPKDRPIVGAEIGVHHGNNAKKLLEGLPNLTLYLVDRWRVYTDEQRNRIQNKGKDWKKYMVNKDQTFFDEAFASASKLAKRFPGRAIIVRMDSVEAADHVPDNLDFAFIDGDHHYEGAKRDIIAWLPKIKDGGVLLGHDIHHSGVKGAVWDMLGFGFDSDLTWKWKVRK